MKHRKLRIAWSVAWGIAAVLLIVLWAHSYAWHQDGLWLHGGNVSLDDPQLNGGTPLNAPIYAMTSQRGLMGFGYLPDFAKTLAAMQAGSKYEKKIYLLGLSIVCPPGGGLISPRRIGFSH